MKILVVSQYFWPEEFRINDICEELVKEGHEVEVLTGLPNYPKGQIFEGYSIFKKGEKEYKGIKIIRVSIVPRGKNLLMLGLNYLSYMISASITSIKLLFRNYDRVFVFQLSPITLAIPGIIISKIKKIPSYIYIQDLWPESLYSIKNIRNKQIRKILDFICFKIYNHFDKLFITSKRFEENLVKRNIDKNKIEYLPQWAEDEYKENISRGNLYLDKFVITFAGNIGKAQSVDTIIKAAALCKNNENILWHIYGDGSEYENIKNLVNKNNLNNTVKLFGRKPYREMPYYFSKASALIVTLKNDPVLNATLPAKVQSYMATGKPILAAINGEGKFVIDESQCGLVSHAENYKELYSNVIKMYNMSENERKSMGEKGKQYFEKNFNKEKLFEKLVGVMEL